MKVKVKLSPESGLGGIKTMKRNQDLIIGET